MKRYRLRWPWDHTEADRHAEIVEQRDVKVNAIYREASKQKAENHIGSLLGTLFVSHPKEHR